MTGQVQTRIIWRDSGTHGKNNVDVALLIAGLLFARAVEVTVQSAWADITLVVVMMMIMLSLGADSMAKGHVIIMRRIGCEAGRSSHKDHDGHHDLT
jgi:hypothetical protein